MTRGKKALSAMPRNQRSAISPPKLCAATVNRVMDPKENIIRGRTRLGPYFLPAMPRNGAVRTKGMKKVDKMMLYWLPVRFRSSSRPAVFAFPRLPFFASVADSALIGNSSPCQVR